MNTRMVSDALTNVVQVQRLGVEMELRMDDASMAGAICSGGASPIPTMDPLDDGQLAAIERG